MARGNASKVFHPFLLPGDLNGNSEDLRNKLLVNFDPMRCFVGDVEASIMQCLNFDHVAIAFYFILGQCFLCLHLLFLNVERVLQHLQAMV